MYLQNEVITLQKEISWEGAWYWEYHQALILKPQSLFVEAGQNRSGLTVSMKYGAEVKNLHLITAFFLV